MMGTLMPSTSATAAGRLTSCAAVADPLLEPGQVVEQLRDDKVCAGIALVFQPLQIALGVFRVGVRSRVARNTDAEEVAMLFADIAHEVIGMLEVVDHILRLVGVLLPAWCVAAKRKNVRDT